MKMKRRISVLILISVLLTLVPTAFAGSDEVKLTASDGAMYDYFGYSVSISGDYAIIGSYADDTDSGSDSGSAYIFKRNGTSWSEQAKITASDGAAGDKFGRSVSISGDYAIVGAYADDDSGSDSGAAYIFKWNGTSWIEQAKIIASDGESRDLFGYSVSISGDYVLVGAYYDDDHDSASGSAYIFKRNGTLWSEQAKITASDGAMSDYFGISVSISGDYALMGARGDDDSGSMSGSAYIFKRDGTSWIEQAKIDASDGAASDYFGYSVSISGDYAIVGAYADDDSGSTSGSAYIFERNGTSWSEQVKITASDSAVDDRFGYSTFIDGNRISVSAYRNGDRGVDSGSAYIFERNGTSWSERAKITASDGAASDYFGISVAISGDYALMGAFGDDDRGSIAGSAYIYDLLTPPPPDPTNLLNTADNFWVNYTWQAGDGNVTDSYNVNMNGVWTNGTTATFLNTTVGSGGWANITVWAWNESGILGALSTGCVSDSVQAMIVPIPPTFNCTCGDICVNTSGWWRDHGVFNANATTPIQAAVDNADAGDTICVASGSYTENVNVTKRLTLQGASAGAVTVTAADSSDHVFEVTADYVGISGFHASGATSSGAGFYLANADHCNISNNTVSGNYHGIYLHYSSNNTLTSNTADSNTYGICLYSSSNNTLTSNTANSNDYGILLYYSSDYNTLTSNTANSNTYGIFLMFSSSNLIHNNYFSNTNNAYDTENNFWNTAPTEGTNIIGGAWLGGNYWSDYAGDDTTDNGLGDTLLPYSSSGNIQNGGDYHPLVWVIVTYPPPDPATLTSTTGNFWVNHIWSAGSGNITDSYNVSVNGVWHNTTTDTSHNATCTAHAWQNITIHAWNASGTGTLSAGSVSQNTEIPNNPVTVENTSDWSGTAGGNVYVDYDASDVDSDTPVFSCNRTDLFTDFSTATGQGNWTTTSTYGGIYYVDFGVSDGWGSTSNYTMAIMVYDVTPPMIRSVVLNTTEIYPGGSIFVTANVTDGVGVASVTANNVSLSLTNGTYEGTITAAYAPGMHSVTVVATDTSGNEATNNSTMYTVLDTTPPTIHSVDLDTTEVYPGGSIFVTVNVSATDSSGIASVTADNVTLEGDGNGTWTGIITAPDTPGTYTVTVVATDTSGNAATNDSVMYTVPDETLPMIHSVVLNTTEVYPGGSIAVTVTATDDSGIASVTADNVTLEGDGSGAWTGIITAPDTIGTYTVTVVATDNSTNANNVTNDSATYTVTEEPVPIANIYIEDVAVIQGRSKTIPITVFDVVDLGGCEINFTYDPAVICMAGVTQGDMRYSFKYKINNGSGWVYANALDVGGLSGDVAFAYINLVAVGDAGDTSLLNITYTNIFDINYTKIPHTVRNGSFVILSANETTPPEIHSVTLDPAVVISNGLINVTVIVTDVSGIASVTADNVSLEAIGNDTWAGTITAASDPGTYSVTVVATDASNNGNVAEDNSATYEVRFPVIYIEDVDARQGERVTVPITVFDVADLSVCEINFTYDPAIVHVTDVNRGDLRYSFKFNVNNGSGWMRANALDADGLSGNMTFAYVTLTAVGNKDDVSAMEFEDSRLLDRAFKEIAHSRRNGTFSIWENVTLKVTNVSATPDTILYDNGRPRTPGTNITSLSAHVSDVDGSITAVTIDLSSIGGSPVQPMAHVSGDKWEVTTNTTEVIINAPHFTHQLTITATADDGGINDSVSIELTVLKRGDVNGDGIVNKTDADYISNYVAGLEPEASNPPDVLVGDVAGESGGPLGDGIVDMMDALYIAKYMNGMVEEP